MKTTQARTITAVVAAAVAAAMLTLAGSHGAQAEASKPQSSSGAGVYLVVTHKVYDHAFWSRAHERTAAVKRERYGWQSGAVYAVDGDRNHVMVMERFASLERARAFADSTDLRDEMAASGVSSNPEVKFVTAN